MLKVEESFATAHSPRRAPAKPPPPMPPVPHRRGRTRNALIAALVAVVVFAVIAAVAANRSSGTGPAVGLPGPGAVPIDYHITYRVTTGKAVDAEELVVHRPFEARDGNSVSNVVARMGRQLLHATGGSPGVLDVAPGPTSLDVRLDAVAEDAMRSKLLVVKGTQSIAGRACRVYRSAQSLQSAELTGIPRSSDYVDTCIDGDGLVLGERVVSHGKATRQRVAVTVTVGAAAADGTYATPGTHIPLKQGGGLVTTVSDSSRPPAVPFWQPSQAPAGFTHLGRFAVARAQPQVNNNDNNNQAAAPGIASMDDLYVRGPDVIIVEQGQTFTGAPIPAPVGGTSVELGALGHGELVLSALSSSVTAQPLNRSSFVRVSGTVTPGQLVQVARSLAQQPPGTLTTVPNLTTDGP